MLDLLWSEFNRSDDVARAAARFETDVHEKMVQRRVDDGFSEDEAGDISRVFRADEFNEVYRRLMLLRMERALIRTLKLEDYEKEIMQERIHTVFSPSTATKPVVITSDRIQVGTNETHQIQDLKLRGRSRRGR
jgi:hypothetical protein